jgi:DNA-binding CsgD family transcriptional regulator
MYIHRKVKEILSDYSIESIRALTKVVLEEPEPNFLAATIALQTLSHLDCRGVIIGVVQHEGFLDLIGIYRYPEQATSPFKRLPLWSSLPITDAIRTGKINIFQKPSEIAEKYPSLVNLSNDDVGEMVLCPITFRSCVIGAIGFTSMLPTSNNFKNCAGTESMLDLCGIYLRNWLMKKTSEPITNYKNSRMALSSRQKQVIKYFEEKLTTEQIAERLKYSPSTIKQDIMKIYDLLGVHTRDQVLEIMKKVDLVG